MDALQKFSKEIEDCQKCGLAGSRTHLVFGEGNHKADIVFVGEAPGKNEDHQARPFIGTAGKLLSELLDSIGLKREDVYIANVVKCRPPENRNPKAEEIASCIPYLWKQIEWIRPKVVCTLGNFATQTLLGQKTGIMKLRGQPIQVKNFIVYPMLHPAAVLHQGNLRPILAEDFQELRKFLGKASAPISPSEQTKLF